MGFFGGDNEPTPAEQLANDQLEMQKAELESKKQSLYNTRLDIIKGQGRETWTPDTQKKAQPKQQKPNPYLPGDYYRYNKE